MSLWKQAQENLPERKVKKNNFEKAELSQFPFLLFFLKGIPLQRMTFQKPVIIDDMTDSDMVIGGIWLYSASKTNALISFKRAIGFVLWLMTCHSRAANQSSKHGIQQEINQWMRTGVNKTREETSESLSAELWIEINQIVSSTLVDNLYTALFFSGVWAERWAPRSFDVAEILQKPCRNYSIWPWIPGATELTMLKSCVFIWHKLLMMTGGVLMLLEQIKYSL